LWGKILNKAFEHTVDGGHVALVTPASWLHPNFKQRDVMFGNRIKYIDLTCKSYFPGVGSTFTAWIVEKTPAKQNSTFVLKDGTGTVQFTLSQTKFLPGVVPDNFNVAYSIVNKTLASKLPKLATSTTMQHHSGNKSTHYLRIPHSNLYILFFIQTRPLCIAM